MYNSTKEYIKRQILQLIEQCNDTKHKQGSVNLRDIQTCINELNGGNMSAGYHDVEDLYKSKEDVGNVLVNYDEGYDGSIWISDFGIFNVEELDRLIDDLMKAKDKLGWTNIKTNDGLSSSDVEELREYHKTVLEGIDNDCDR